MILQILNPIVMNLFQPKKILLTHTNCSNQHQTVPSYFNQQHLFQPTTTFPTNNIYSNQQLFQPTTNFPTNNIYSNQQLFQPTTNFPTNNNCSNQDQLFQPTKETYKLHPFQENIRWMRFWHSPQSDNSIAFHIDLYKIDNIQQTIRYKQGCKKILIFKPSFQGQTVILKNLSGYLQLERGGGNITLWKLEKEKHTIRQLNVLGFQDKFVTNVKKIKANDFEHFAEDFKPNAKHNLLIFNN